MALQASIGGVIKEISPKASINGTIKDLTMHTSIGGTLKQLNLLAPTEFIVLKGVVLGSGVTDIFTPPYVTKYTDDGYSEYTFAVGKYSLIFNTTSVDYSMYSNLVLTITPYYPPNFSCYVYIGGTYITDFTGNVFNQSFSIPEYTSGDIEFEVTCDPSIYLEIDEIKLT